MLKTIWHKYLKRPYKLQVLDETLGSPERTIIFLHGLAGANSMWRKTIDGLTDCRVISIDLLGFGSSPKPDFLSYTIHDQKRMLRYTLQKLHVAHKPITIVGHSLGALIGIEYTHAYPRHIQRLVLIAPPLYSAEDDESAKKSLGFDIAKRQLAGLYSLYKFARDQPKWTITAIQRARLISPVARTMLLSEETWLPFTRTLQNAIEFQEVYKKAVELTVPSTIIYGTADAVIIPHFLQKAAAKNNQMTLCTIRGGTHAIDRRMRNAIYTALDVKQPVRKNILRPVLPRRQKQ